MPSVLLRSSWSAPLATTSLRLLLDECVDRSLEDDIKRISRSLKVEALSDLQLANMGYSDDNLVDYAREKDRIVVTTESRLSEKRFAICTHPGIIVIKATSRHSALKSRMFRDLALSGTRRRCNHAVTYLRLDKTGTRTLAIFKERDDSTGQIRSCTIDLTSGQVLNE